MSDSGLCVGCRGGCRQGATRAEVFHAVATVKTFNTRLNIC